MVANIGVLRRPVSSEGIWGWLTPVDPKRIGILYGVSAFFSSCSEESKLY